eukprot:m51a1_g9422 putative C-tail anchored protein (198) ;mRNA; f:374692-375727
MSIWKLVVVVAFAALVFAEEPAAAAAAETAEEPAAAPSGARAQLVVSRKLLNDTLVETIPAFFEVTVWNVGNEVASEVVLNDTVFGTPFTATIATLAAQESVTKQYQAVPQQVGRVELAALVYTFKPTPTSEARAGHVVDLAVYVNSLQAYNRSLSHRYLEWAIVIGATAVLVGIPGALWRSYCKKYAALFTAKKSQ